MLNLLYDTIFYGLCMAAILDFCKQKHVPLLNIKNTFSFIFFFFQYLNMSKNPGLTGCCQRKGHLLTILNSLTL